MTLDYEKQNSLCFLDLILTQTLHVTCYYPESDAWLWQHHSVGSFLMLGQGDWSWLSKKPTRWPDEKLIQTTQDPTLG